MSINKVTSTGWSILWLLFAASIVIPFFLSYISQWIPTILTVIGIGVALFFIAKVARQFIAHKWPQKFGE